MGDPVDGAGSGTLSRYDAWRQVNLREAYDALYASQVQLKSQLFQLRLQYDGLLKEAQSLREGWAKPGSEKSQVYFSYWDPACKEDWNPKPTGFERMQRDFAHDSSSWNNGEGGSVPDDINVLWAVYHDPWGYSGQAFVLFEKDDKLWFVEGGHCSCHGLEGQWAPDEVTPKQMVHILLEGTQFDYLEKDALEALVRVLCSLKDGRRWR